MEKKKNVLGIIFVITSIIMNVMIIWAFVSEKIEDLAKGVRRFKRKIKELRRHVRKVTKLDDEIDEEDSRW